MCWGGGGNRWGWRWLVFFLSLLLFLLAVGIAAMDSRVPGRIVDKEMRKCLYVSGSPNHLVPHVGQGNQCKNEHAFFSMEADRTMSPIIYWQRSTNLRYCLTVGPSDCLTFEPCIEDKLTQQWTNENGQLKSESARSTASKAQCVASSTSLMNNAIRVAPCEPIRTQMWSFVKNYPVPIEEVPSSTRL